MLMFAYIVGGWVLANAYISKTFMYSGKKAKFQSRKYSKILNYATFDKRPKRKNSINAEVGGSLRFRPKAEVF